MKVVFCGDLMLGEWYFRQGFGMGKVFRRNGAGFFLKHIAPELKGADAVVGNLECVLAPAEKSYRQPMLADERFLPALKKAGFSVISLANNHIMDFGLEPALYTISRLREAGFHLLGLKDSPSLKWECGEWQIEIWAADILPIHHRRPPYPADTLIFSGKIDAMGKKLEAQIRRSSADIKLVYLHWGEEFMFYPCPLQVSWAQRLLEAGAYAVVGSHTHTPQPVALYNLKPVAYSLGNFLSDMPYPPTKIGYLFVVQYDREKRGWNLVPYMKNDDLQPVPTGFERSGDFWKLIEEGKEALRREGDFRQMMTLYSKTSRRAEEEFWRYTKEYYRRNFFKYPASAHWGWFKEKLKRL